MTTIGIDLSPLQSPHRMRGIGITLLNFINNISAADRQNNKYVLFMFETGEAETLQLLDLNGMNYKVSYLRPQPTRHHNKKSIVSERVQRLINSTKRQLSELKDRYAGNSLVQDTKGVDVFIQTDQNQSLPHNRGMKKILIIYDIIPYILEWEYFWSYKTARMHGFSRKASLRCQARRSLYIKKLKLNTRRADLLLEIGRAHV